MNDEPASRAPPPSLSRHEPASARKLAAKRINERVKLLAALLNSLSLGVIGAGVIVPGIADPARITLQTLTWIAIGLVLHFIGQVVFAFLRSED